MQYHILASGSKGNSFVLKDQDVYLMIDCGSSKTYLTKSLKKLNIKPKDLSAVLITHDHYDHISQIKLFQDNEIYTPIQLEGVNYQIIEPYQVFYIKHLKITAIPLSHDSEVVVGYIIESDIEKLVYVTDTGYLSLKNQAYIKDADYYIFESNHDPEMLMNSDRPYHVKQRILSANGHLCNEDAVEILARAVTTRSKEIVLAHLSEEANDHQLATATATKRFNGLGVKVTTAQQFEIVSGGRDE